MEPKPTKYNEACENFTNWIESSEKRISSACHCVAQNWQNVIVQHQKFQAEVEEVGMKLSHEVKLHIAEDKSCTKQQWKESKDLEHRWYKVWLSSLEQLVVVESLRRCPKHNSTLIGKPSPPPAKVVGRTNRIRPISYPSNSNERLEWDYRHTLSLTGCHKENGSQMDLDSIDEQITKNLTEFGENYELWFGKEDEVACVTVHSRPPSVEPAEKPEVAKAVVSDLNTNGDVTCNLLMLTTPSSMFSVEASKCIPSKRRSHTWRIIGPILFAIFVLLFSAIYQEPHHMHKSYYHTQPPV